MPRPIEVMPFDEFLLERGLTYNALATKSGVSHDTIRRIVRKQSIKLHTARKLAEALGVKITEFLKVLERQGTPLTR